MLFWRLGTTSTSPVIWGLHDLERNLPACESLYEIARHVGRCRLHRRYQFKPWTARRVDRDFRGLLKRGGIGIGFGCFFQGLDGFACSIGGPIADKDHAAWGEDAP